MNKYLEFLHEVKALMEQDEWFFLDPDEEVYRLMARNAMGIWLAEDGGRIASVFCVVYPGLEQFNLGYDLDFSEEELMQVVHMDTAAVHPDYRGRGLQYRMMLHAERELNGKILLCTIHPDNKYSLNNVCTNVVPVNEVDVSELTTVKNTVFDGHCFASAEEYGTEVTVCVH